MKICEIDKRALVICFLTIPIIQKRSCVDKKKFSNGQRMINGKEKQDFFVVLVDYHAKSISLTPIFHFPEKKSFFYFFYYVNFHFK